MNTISYTVTAIVAALAMFGVVMVTIATTMQLQEAEARGGGCLNAQTPGVPFNASLGRCFRP